MPTTRRPAEERFWEKVLKTDTCWLWTGAIVKKTGYARFMAEPGKVVQAHRWAYGHFVGPIPEGHQVDHVKARGCAHRHCVNPAHLEAVTQRENLVRGDGWAGQARKTHCPQGHSLDDALIHHGRRECRQCNKDRCRARRLARQGATCQTPT